MALEQGYRSGGNDSGSAPASPHDAALRALRALADSAGRHDPSEVVAAVGPALVREFPGVAEVLLTPSVADDPSPWRRFLPDVSRAAAKASGGAVERIPIRLGRAIPLTLSAFFHPRATPDEASREALRSLGPVVSLLVDLTLAFAETRGLVRMRTRLVESVAKNSSIAVGSLRQILFAGADATEEGAFAFAPQSRAPEGRDARIAEPRFDVGEVVNRMRGWLGAFVASRGSALRVSLGPNLPASAPGSSEIFGTAIIETLDVLTADRPRASVILKLDGSPDGTDLLFEAAVEATAASAPAAAVDAPARVLTLAPVFFLRRGGRFDEERLESRSERGVRGRIPCAESTVKDGRGPAPAHSIGPGADRTEAVDESPLVLVVDDEVYSRYTVRCLLEREGYRVETAADGLEALEKVGAARPAIVIMDLNMPRCDGLEAARRMRADETLKGLPLLAMTARSQETAVGEALGAGFDGIIQKPFFLPELLTVVRHWLGENEAAPEGTGAAS